MSSESRKVVYIEYGTPWLIGGYSSTIINNKDVESKAVGFVVKDTDRELVICLGESDGNYLHQISIPKSCVTKCIDLSSLDTQLKKESH